MLSFLKGGPNIEAILPSLLFTSVIAAIPTACLVLWRMMRLQAYFRTTVTVPQATAIRGEKENEIFKYVGYWVSCSLQKEGKQRFRSHLDGATVFCHNRTDVQWGLTDGQAPRSFQFAGTTLWISLDSKTGTATQQLINGKSPLAFRITIVNYRIFANLLAFLPCEVVPHLVDPAAVVVEFLEACKEAWDRKEKQHTRIFVASVPTQYKVMWTELGSRPSRPFDTVLLQDGLAEDLLADVREFMAEEEWYFSHGVPYRRGYLLHGMPGCGKTSFITALAGELQMPIYIVNLSNRDISDEKLLSLITSAPKGSFLLLEDVDRAWSQESGVTFSGLLNAIDGAAGQEGKVLFMTTNHFDELDEALVRPGRVDRSVLIKPAAPAQARALFLNFFPQQAFRDFDTDSLATEFEASVAAYLETFPGRVLSVAELQGLLVQNKRDPVAAASSFSETRSLQIKKES